jgi:hypothetical protein
MKIRKCCFCQYEGNERSFRNVGTEEYPDDYLCEMCDTKESRR